MPLQASDGDLSVEVSVWADSQIGWRRTVGLCLCVSGQPMPRAGLHSIVGSLLRRQGGMWIHDGRGVGDQVLQLLQAASSFEDLGQHHHYQATRLGNIVRVAQLGLDMRPRRAPLSCALVPAGLIAGLRDDAIGLALERHQDFQSLAEPFRDQ